MIDREKVIKGLECHAEVNCVECPYRDGWRTCKFGETLLADAIALLREQDNCENCAIAIEDRQPVVRCKDCKYGEQCIPPCEDRYCIFYDERHDGKWFCADGERKDDDA